MVGAGNRADFGADMAAQNQGKIVAWLDPCVQCDIAINALSLNIVRKTDDGGFGNQVVQHQRAFHLCGAHAVTRYVDNIIDAARDPVIIITVAAASIASKIFARIVAEIGLHKTVMVAV